MAVQYIDENNFIIAGAANPPIYPAADPADAYVALLGNTSTIKGTITAPPNFDQTLINVTKPGYQRSTIPRNNAFSLDVDTGSYAVALSLQNPYYNVTLASSPVVFNNYFSTATVAFTITPTAGQQDMVVSALALNSARPGFTTSYWIFYRNVGTVTIPSGTVRIKKDPRLSRISGTTPSSSAGDIITYDFSNLQPFDSASISVNFSVLAPPAVNIGDILSSVVDITPAVGDVTPENDSAIIRQRVVGAFDPNDKAENFAGEITPARMANADYVNYVIRFQNTGNDTAFTVHVRDTLDAYLDWNSLQVIGASHPYELHINQGNILDWEFSDLQLVDSTTNESLSHGYIAYRVKTKNNIPLEDSIHNTASIYFDYNLPVATNNAFIVVKQSITLPLKLLSFSANYEQPNAVLHWSTAEEYNVKKFEIERSTDALRFTRVGEVLSVNGGGAGNYVYNDGLTGVTGNRFFYRLKMIDMDGRFTYSEIQLVQKNGVTGNEIKVNPNPVTGGSARAIIISDNARQAVLQVIDQQGRVVLRRSQRVNKGYNSLELDLSRLKSAIYTLRLEAEGKVLATNFIKLK